MVWSNWQDFLYMGGYGSYVWGSVVVALGAVIMEWMSVRARWIRVHRK